MHVCKSLLICFAVGLSSDLFACNPEGMALHYLEEDEKLALVEKIRSGEDLEIEERIEYETYYKRALREMIEPVSEKYPNMGQSGLGEMRSAELLNLLEGNNTRELSLPSARAEYGVYRQTTDAYFLEKKYNVSINGVPITDTAKNTIRRAGKHFFIERDPVDIAFYFNKKLEPVGTARIMRDKNLSFENPVDPPVINLEQLHSLVTDMEENQTALIHLHRFYGEPGQPLNQRMIFDPILVHLHRERFYIISLSPLSEDLSPVVTAYAKNYFFDLDMVQGGLSVDLIRRFRAAIIDDYIQTIDSYRKELDYINNRLTMVVGLDEDEITRLNSRLKIVKDTLRKLGERILAENKPIEDIYYSFSKRTPESS